MSPGEGVSGTSHTPYVGFRAPASNKGEKILILNTTQLLPHDRNVIAGREHYAVDFKSGGQKKGNFSADSGVETFELWRAKTTGVDPNQDVGIIISKVQFLDTAPGWVTLNKQAIVVAVAKTVGVDTDLVSVLAVKSLKDVSTADRSLSSQQGSSVFAEEATVSGDDLFIGGDVGHSVQRVGSQRPPRTPHRTLLRGSSRRTSTRLIERIQVDFVLKFEKPEQIRAVERSLQLLSVGSPSTTYRFLKALDSALLERAKQPIRMKYRNVLFWKKPEIFASTEDIARAIDGFTTTTTTPPPNLGLLGALFETNSAEAYKKSEIDLPVVIAVACGGGFIVITVILAALLACRKQLQNQRGDHHPTIGKREQGGQSGFFVHKSGSDEVVAAQHLTADDIANLLNEEARRHGEDIPKKKPPKYRKKVQPEFLEQKERLPGIIEDGESGGRGNSSAGGPVSKDGGGVVDPASKEEGKNDSGGRSGTSTEDGTAGSGTLNPSTADKTSQPED